MDALVSLIATYYVFHQTYAKEVLTTLLFIQSQVHSLVWMTLTQKSQML